MTWLPIAAASPPDSAALFIDLIYLLIPLAALFCVIYLFYAWDVTSGGSSGDVFEQTGDDDMNCPSCLGQNLRGARFCRHCGAPIGETTTLEPFGQILAGSWILGKASRRKSIVFKIFMIAMVIYSLI